MASENGKRPRIRKTAPTIRQRTEAAQLKSAEQRNNKPGKVSLSLRKILRPFSLIFRYARPVFRPLKKILSLIFPRYFINAWREVRLVTWPNRKETWRLTGAVFIFAVIFGALVAGVDKGLDELFKKVVLK